MSSKVNFNKNKQKSSMSGRNPGRSKSEKTSTQSKKVQKRQSKSQKTAKNNNNRGGNPRLSSNVQSGIKPTRGDESFIHFGQFVIEFLNNDQLGKKSISVKYDADKNEFTVFNFTFALPNETGVFFGDPKTLSKDQYMKRRSTLLGIKGPQQVGTIV
jgi:hypothetical protein